MYQLATECRPGDKTQTFMLACTSMTPTPETMHLVRSAASLVREVLDGGKIEPLRELLARADEWCDADDALAVAGQAVIDELDALPRVQLHDMVRRVAQIERDALAGRFRPAYAA